MALILGEFEELVLLMVAALHDKAYGVLILEGLEDELDKKLTSALFMWHLIAWKTKVLSSPDSEALPMSGVAGGRNIM